MAMITVIITITIRTIITAIIKRKRRRRRASDDDEDADDKLQSLRRG